MLFNSLRISRLTTRRILALLPCEPRSELRGLQGRFPGCRKLCLATDCTWSTEILGTMAPKRTLVRAAATGEDVQVPSGDQPCATASGAKRARHSKVAGSTPTNDPHVLTETTVHNTVSESGNRRSKAVLAADVADNQPAIDSSDHAANKVTAAPKVRRRKAAAVAVPDSGDDAPSVEREGSAGTGTATGTAKPSRSKKQAKPPVVFWSPTMRPAPPTGPALRMLSWNVAGLRAVLKKEPDVLSRLAESQQADVICLQEIKISPQHIQDMAAAVKLQGWHMHWNCSSTKAGYSGVAILSRSAPLSVQAGLGIEEHDGEGRAITAEFPDHFLVTVYAVNSGEGLKRLDYRVGAWDVAFAAFVKTLEARKPVVICGDLNCAHQEIDIHAPKTNLRSSGFTQEERDSFTNIFIDSGFVDTFRTQHPGVTAYTYWTYKFGCRAKNKGWRIDYFLVSRSLGARVHDSYMLPDVMGSDHCPVGLILNTPLREDVADGGEAASTKP